MNVQGQLPRIGAPSSNENPTCPTKFGGIGDAVSNVVGFIDGNRLAELASTDILGMCLPRTAIEASLRPSGYRRDAARETAIREFSGLVMNTVAVGALSYLSLRLLGNNVNWYNPLGIPGRAWISADSMEAFGSLYEHILQDSSITTPTEARERFVRTILSGMASSNKKASLISMLQAAEGLDNKARSAFLESAFSDSPEALGKLRAILNQNPERLTPFTDELNAGYRGKFSPETLEKLVAHFTQKAGRFDVQAAQRAQERLLENPKIKQYLSEECQEALSNLPAAERYKELIKVLPAPMQAEARQVFLKSRLGLSMGDLRYGESAFINHADQLALSGGLTESVQLLDVHSQPLVRDQNGKPLITGKNRKTLLREMKHFLEQYIDRAHHEARQHQDWKSKAHEILYGKGDQPLPNWWQKIVANADDGLIPASIKSKWAFTWIPLSITVLASIGVAFYNNWLTQQKHGGRVISPIDGSTQDKAAPQTSEALQQPTINTETPFRSRFSDVSKSPSASPFGIFQQQERAAL